MDATSYLNEQDYLGVLAGLVDLHDQNQKREDRTGVGTTSTFGVDLYIDITEGRMPLISTKKIHIPSIKHELIWMLSGQPNIAYLKENKVNIWDDWLAPGTEVKDSEGKLVDGISSSIYGESWRKWVDTRVMSRIEFESLPSHDSEGRLQEPYNVIAELPDNQVVVTREVDQIARVLWQLKNKPNSRRIILNGWNAARVGDVKLPPCHMTAQFYVEGDQLSCRVYLRSNDWFLGAPFNLVQYTLLTNMFAKAAGLKAKTLIYSVGDCHLYNNHIDQARQQLSREIIMENSPRLILKEGSGSFECPTLMTADMIDVEGYVHHDAIKAPIAV